MASVVEDRLMYMLIDYLTYVTMVALSGVVFLAACAGVLATREAVRILATSSRRTVSHLFRFASKTASGPPLRQDLGRSQREGAG